MSRLMMFDPRICAYIRRAKKSVFSVKIELDARMLEGVF
jgi:thioredoxin-related protein